MKTKLIFLGCLVAISTSLWAMDAGEFRGETKAKIEILQKQNDELTTKIDEIEKNNVNIETFNTSIVDQDKRIQDLSFYTSLIATIIAILTLIAGVGGVAFPYVMYKQNTKAQETAKKDIESWKEKTMLEFDKELESFKKHAQGAKSEITTSVEEAKKVESEIKNIQNGLQDGQSISQNEPNNDSSLSKVAIKVREKPQSEYTFDDWNNLAFDAYKKDKKEDALFYWRKAVEIDEILSNLKAITLVNIAITLSKLDRKEDAIKICDEVIKEFQETQNEDIKEEVIRAYNIKGVRLGELKRNEEALSVFNHVLIKYKDCENENIKNEVKKAYVNQLEMLLITGKKIDKKVEQNFDFDERKKSQLFMLQTLQNALTSDQTEKIQEFRNKFPDVNFKGWGWDELTYWASNLENIEAKTRVLATIEQFKNW